ncbi:hypothetical protein Bbelb_128610 [Branchiostoma belcheri]|nr:hypothetical protein Bbelb_128610 [Branchiostoma belcheri]
MFSLTVLLVAVTVASAADTTQPTTTQPTTTWTTPSPPTPPSTIAFVPGCESHFTWPGPHALGETWHEQFESYCRDCVCLATGKQCEPCPPRDCYSKPWEQYYPSLAVGETAIVELTPGFCVLCECQDYSASCSSYPCDGIIT